MKTVVLSILLFICFFDGKAQQIIPLYEKIPNSIPNQIEEVSQDGGASVMGVTKPTLTVYLPRNNNSNTAAVIICPGGAYSKLSMESEGYSVAEKLNEMGISAFVLKYRLPDDSTMLHKEFGSLLDVQRAIQLVRENAIQFHIDTAKVGIMGFSAGGHLAASASSHYEKSYIPNEKSTNLRPSFSVLIYPVISFSDNLTHKGSRRRLLGGSPSSEQIDFFSNELYVNVNTPPVFFSTCTG